MSFSPKIIVLGEKAIDVFEYFKATKQNPESPATPVLVPVRMEVRGGMAENVYNNLRSLGLKENELCFISNGTAIVKKRLVEYTTNSIIARIDENDDVVEKNHEYFCGDTFKKLKGVIEDCKTVKALIISDYCKGFIDSYWIELIADLCEKNGVTTFMDTRKKLNDFSRKIDYIKINTKEFEELSEPTKYAKNIIVTRGDKGAEWINRGLFYPTKPVHNPIVCGAGDSFMAALVLNFIQTNDIPESIKFANAAARVRVSKNEQTVTLGEIPQNWRES